MLDKKKDTRVFGYVPRAKVTGDEWMKGKKRKKKVVSSSSSASSSEHERDFNKRDDTFDGASKKSNESSLLHSSRSASADSALHSKGSKL